MRIRATARHNLPTIVHDADVRSPKVDVQSDVMSHGCTRGVWLIISFVAGCWRTLTAQYNGKTMVLGQTPPRNLASNSSLGAFKHWQRPAITFVNARR